MRHISLTFVAGEVLNVTRVTCVFSFDPKMYSMIPSYVINKILAKKCGHATDRRGMKHSYVEEFARQAQVKRMLERVDVKTVLGE